MYINLVVGVLMFVGTMRFAISENPDPLGLLYHDESKNSNPSTEDNYHMSGYDSRLEDKTVEKRRFVYEEPDDRNPNGPNDGYVRYPEIREYPPRNKNHSPEVEVEKRGPERVDRKEEEKIKYSYSPGFDQAGGVRKEEEKIKYSYSPGFDQTGAVRKEEEKIKYSYSPGFDQAGAVRKEEEKIKYQYTPGFENVEGYKTNTQFARERTGLRGRFNWVNREIVGEERQPLAVDTNSYQKDYSLNGYDRRAFAMDPRELRQPKHFDADDTFRTTQSLYFPRMSYNGLHNIDCCGTDKPLIINVNTDGCFPPNKNLYFQRFFTQKPNLNTPMSSYQIPDTSVLPPGNQGYYSSYKR